MRPAILVAIAAILFSSSATAGGSNYVEVVAVTDSAYHVFYADEAEAAANSLMMMVGPYFALSSASPFVLVHTTTVVLDADPWTVPANGSGEVDPLALLDAFNAWAAANVPAHDVAVLLSGRTFVQPTVGLAFTAAACTSTSGAVVQANHFGDVQFDALTVAHEVGHLLGACHDPPATRTSPLCAALPPEVAATCSGFVMSAASNPQTLPTQFSACSGLDFANALENRLPAGCFAAPGGEACTPQPRPSCRIAAKSRLAIRSASDPTQDALTWRWTNGDATAPSDLGDPSDTTEYRLCVYDEVGGVASIAVDAAVPAGAHWTGGKHGRFTYKNLGGAPSGVRQVTLAPGADGKAKVTLVGKGRSLPLGPPATPDALLAADPAVRVQLVSSTGSCFESAFPTAGVKLNTVHQFVANAGR